MNARETRTVDLRVRLRQSEADKLHEMAERDGELTVSAIVRKAIQRFIAEHENAA